VSDDRDQGGDPACWAHLADDDTAAIDLTRWLDAAGDGVHWTLGPPSDLNANLVRLEPEHAMPEHTNTEVDVLLVVLSGNGHVDVDGTRVALAANVVAHVPKGATRVIHAGREGLAYLSVHRRRGGLTIDGA
jgi:quercetin dioxygenase-like cupin family protein